MRFGSLDIPAIFADGRAIVELKTATGAFDPSGKSPIERYLRGATGHADVSRMMLRHLRSIRLIREGFGLPITREVAELYGETFALGRSAIGGRRAIVTLNQDQLRRDRDEWRWRAERLLADLQRGGVVEVVERGRCNARRCHSELLRSARQRAEPASRAESKPG